MKEFVSGWVMASIFISLLFIVRGFSTIYPEDVEESIEICEYRGGLADIMVWTGENVYYYCKDGYQALPAPTQINPIRADFERYVKREGLDMHLGFTDGKYSSRSTQEAFVLFCAGAEAK